MTSGALLAHLVTHFSADRTEDIATEALAHVCRNSEAARRALASLGAATGAEIQLARLVTQQPGEESAARPDLTGYARDGSVELLLEAKFGAGLTDNQPHEYIRETAKLVLLVIPERRMEPLWPEILRRAALAGQAEPVKQSGYLRWLRVDGEKTLAIVSWRTLVEKLATTVGVEDPEKSGDLEQLAALCDVFESNTFIPFTSEDLTSDLPRVIMQLIEVVDDLVNRLLAYPDINKKGLKSTSGAGWYGHYLNLSGSAAILYFSAARWREANFTPIWLRVKEQWGSNHNPYRTEEALAPLWGTQNQPQFIDGQWEIPIRIGIGMDHNLLVDSIMNQIDNAVTLLREKPGKVDR